MSRFLPVQFTQKNLPRAGKINARRFPELLQTCRDKKYIFWKMENVIWGTEGAQRWFYDRPLVGDCLCYMAAPRPHTAWTCHPIPYPCCTMGPCGLGITRSSSHPATSHWSPPWGTCKKSEEGEPGESGHVAARATGSSGWVGVWGLQLNPLWAVCGSWPASWTALFGILVGF